jgi:hypothetical protein
MEKAFITKNTAHNRSVYAAAHDVLFVRLATVSCPGSGSTRIQAGAASSPVGGGFYYGPRTAQAKAFAHLYSMGDYERYGGPHSHVNALAGAFTCRAPLRLKPSRMCANRGYSERYAAPHLLAQRPAGAVIAGLWGQRPHSPAGPKNIPVKSKNIPAESKNIPVESKNIPVGPKNIPVKSKNIPVGPKNIPAGPKNIPPESKNIPVGPKNIPVESKNIPPGVKDIPLIASFSEIPPGALCPRGLPA